VFTLYRAQGRFRASSLQWRVVVAQLALPQVNKKSITALPNKVSESGHKKSRENSWKKLPTIISASLS